MARVWVPWRIATLQATSAKRPKEARTDKTKIREWEPEVDVGALTGGVSEVGRYSFEIGSYEVVETGRTL